MPTRQRFLQRSRRGFLSRQSGQLFAALSTGINTLEELAAAQTSGGGAAHEGTATRGDAREELRSRMKAWSATAHAIAIDNPGLEHKFRVPRGENDEILIAAARAFATDAVPLTAQFIAHEMGRPSSTT